MSGGGKGGKQTSKVEIPAWLEDPSRRAIQRGEDIASIGYVPYMGPDVAAFTPMQQAAFQGTNDAAAAFGLSAPTDMGLPQAQTFAGGVQGYSSYPGYQQAVDQFRAARPGQAQAMDAMFIDPFTGRPAGPVSGPVQPITAQQAFGGGYGDGGGWGGGGAGGPTGEAAASFGDGFGGFGGFGGGPSGVGGGGGGGGGAK